VLRVVMPLTVVALLCPASLPGQVYRHVDEAGNVAFTDRPAAGATPVEIGATNTMPPPPARVYPPRVARPEPAGGDTADYKVRISSPANETVIPPGPGNFSVTASVTPALGSGHGLQLSIDGAAREEPQTAGSWALVNVFRGERSLAVAVVDEKGRTLAESEPVTVYVFRPSGNNRNRHRSIAPERAE